MKYLVKRISYSDYLAAYSDDGWLSNHFTETGRELPKPVTEEDWIAQQGSIEGPILTATEVDDDYAEKLGAGYSLMDAEEYESQVAFQESLAERLTDDGVAIVEQTPKNQAWASLRDNADLDGSWPELKAALKKAVDSLDEDATAAEIYDKSIELLD